MTITYSVVYRTDISAKVDCTGLLESTGGSIYCHEVKRKLVWKYG